MKTMLRKILLTTLLCIPAMALAFAPPVPDDHDAIVRSFSTFGRLTGWQPLDRDSLIVWVSPKRAYLIDLERPSPYLRHTQRIGITSLNGRVNARFDYVLVDGVRYPIETIYALDRAEAKALLSDARVAS